jgi:hypothetical protein
MKKSLSLLIVATAWVMAASTAHAQLTAPEWNPAGIPVQETTIRLLFSNSNANSSTELYRSTSQGSGYQLIYTAPPGGEYYEDAFLSPRTTYYYKLRAIRDTLVSDFSEVQAHTTYSRFFNPDFSANQQDPMTVALSLHDLSYADMNYDIERSVIGESGSEYVWYLEAQDSGQVHTYLDENLTPGKTYVYSVHVLVHDEGMPYYFDIVKDTVTLTLTTPSFTTSPAPYYENNILLGIHNPNYGSDTEIYRSLSSDSGYELIATIPFEEQAFYDSDLAPRTTFYYKLRAALAGGYSEFSAPRAYTSGSKFYPPTLTGEAIDGRNVRLTLTDNSYDDLEYEIWRDGGPNQQYLLGMVMPDSGQTQIFIDQNLTPNTTYHYRVDARTKGPNNPIHQNVAEATVTTPQDTTLQVPEFSYQAPPEFFCESIINFEYWNPNEGSSTEIYRSLDSLSGFTLIHTAAPGESYFVDDVAPHTKYYYKLRATRDGQVSAFTETRPITSLSEFYNPTIDAEAVNYGFESNWVELTLTDNSYADVSYGILRHEIGTDQWVGIGQERIVLSDSGQTFHFTDENVKPNTTYAYYVDAIINCDGFPQYYEIAVDTVTTLEEYLLPPFFLHYPPSVYPCGNEVAFVMANENEGSLTEVYRSRYPDSGFVLIDTIMNNSDSYLDTGLESRGTYYYKLRAIKGTAVSEFSEVEALVAGPTFYNPILTLTLLPDQTVEVKLLDRTYLEYGYHIYGTAGGTTFVQSVYSGGRDSASVHTYIDSSVVPGRTYSYAVDAELYCDGLPMEREVATASITIPDNTGPAITGFTLVDPYSDIDIRALHDYDTIDGTNRPTIRANVNDNTKSVRFFLNGKRISTSNTDPHSLYGDAKGNYNPGKLKPGDYVFTAVPYSGRKATGVEGTPLTIHFTVFKNTVQQMFMHEDQSQGVDAVSLYPNPLITESNIEVSAPAGSKVKIEIMDQLGNSHRTLFSGKIDSDGYWAKEINRNQFAKGTYLLAVTINGIATIKRFVVE